jgi:hypothetical protein
MIKKSLIGFLWFAFFYVATCALPGAVRRGRRLEEFSAGRTTKREVPLVGVDSPDRSNIAKT